MKQLMALPEPDPNDSELFLTHKGYLHFVKQTITALGCLNEVERKKLDATELLYGHAGSGVYGVCLYDRWFRDGLQDVIQVSAFLGSSPAEQWNTVGHELGHVLAGRDAGHGSRWKAAARKLGIKNPRAFGPTSIDDLDPKLALALEKIPLPRDGRPVCDDDIVIGGAPRGGCAVGIGTRGGRSHGAGSGRLRLWVCECPRPVRVRVASDDFRARCLICGGVFKRADAKPGTTTMLVPVSRH
jgi:hypothetical protein